MPDVNKKRCSGAAGETLKTERRWTHHLRARSGGEGEGGKGSLGESWRVSPGLSQRASTRAPAPPTPQHPWLEHGVPSGSTPSCHPRAETIERDGTGRNTTCLDPRPELEWGRSNKKTMSYLSSSPRLDGNSIRTRDCASREGATCAAQGRPLAPSLASVVAS